MSSFGNNIKKLRKKNNLTQKDVKKYLESKSINISQSYLSRIEKGDREPSIEIQLALASLFNVSTDYLLGFHTDSLITNENTLEKDKFKKIPVLETVTNESLNQKNDNIFDYLDIPSTFINGGNYFGLLISDNSMNPRIQNGDIVIVHQQSYAEDGDIIIVQINGNDGTCKKIKQSSDGIALISLNPEYSPIFFTNNEINKIPIRILGKVVELRAQM